ncbi:MAG: hypothetical protein NT074_05710 [Methanomicrobiales archaeon]|nr:hypothetical protein [Methanomicrobiales archaeon]
MVLKVQDSIPPSPGVVSLEGIEDAHGNAFPQTKQNRERENAPRWGWKRRSST